jgi:hypothetical protein
MRGFQLREKEFHGIYTSINASIELDLAQFVSESF